MHAIIARMLIYFVTCIHSQEVAGNFVRLIRGRDVEREAVAGSRHSPHGLINLCNQNLLRVNLRCSYEMCNWI